LVLSKKALSISPSPTMAIDSKAKEMKSQGIDVVGFGAGEPDFDTPAHIREAGIRAIEEGHTRYTPAAGTLELKEAICDKLKRENDLAYSPAQIVISNGAKHSLHNVLAALLNPGDEVMIPTPYWVSYPEMVRLNDGIPVAIATTEENGFKPTLADLERDYSKKCKALILNSPSNPTGQVCSEDELRMIANFCCERNLFIIADEIYEKLLYGENRHISIATFSEMVKELTILVNGVSKSYAMTGWRIGYTASTKEIATVMSNIQSHTASNANSIAQKAALSALTGPQECVEEMRLAFDERRQYMVDKIKSIPYLDALEPQGTFYLFANVTKTVGKSLAGKKISGSDDFAAHLLESRKVALVPGTGFGAPNHVRLSFATSMENIVEGLDRIEAFINDLQ
jgi:aspartate aminotransferase